MLRFNKRQIMDYFLPESDKLKLIQDVVSWTKNKTVSEKQCIRNGFWRYDTNRPKHFVMLSQHYINIYFCDMWSCDNKLRSPIYASIQLANFIAGKYLYPANPMCATVPASSDRQTVKSRNVRLIVCHVVTNLLITLCL